MNADDLAPTSRWKKLTRSVRTMSLADGALISAGGGIGLVALLITVETLMRWGAEIVSRLWDLGLIVLAVIR